MPAAPESSPAIKRSGSAVIVLTLLTTSALLGVAAPAQAAASVAQGWWTLANPGGLPLEVPAPPDVPSDGLLVQGGPSGPDAMAAVEYQISDGERPDVLTLTVAPGSAMTPSSSLLVCPLKDAGFTPVQGGPAGEAPAYDCTKQVVATAAADGLTFSAKVAPLGVTGTLAVALVPADATSRIVFSKATPDSLTTTPTTSSGGFGGTTDPEQVPDAGTPVDPAVTTPSDSGLAAAPPLDGGAGVVAPSVALPESPQVVGAAPQTASDQAATFNSPLTSPLGSVTGTGHGRRLLVLLLAAVLLAGMLWSYAGASAQGSLAGSADDSDADPSAA